MFKNTYLLILGLGVGVGVSAQESISWLLSRSADKKCGIIFYPNSRIPLQSIDIAGQYIIVVIKQHPYLCYICIISNKLPD